MNVSNELDWKFPSSGSKCWVRRHSMHEIAGECAKDVLVEKGRFCFCPNRELVLDGGNGKPSANILLHTPDRCVVGSFPVSNCVWVS